MPGRCPCCQGSAQLAPPLVPCCSLPCQQHCLAARRRTHHYAARAPSTAATPAPAAAGVARRPAASGPAACTSCPAAAAATSPGQRRPPAWRQPCCPAGMHHKPCWCVGCCLHPTPLVPQLSHSTHGGRELQRDRKVRPARLSIPPCKQRPAGLLPGCTTQTTPIQTAAAPRPSGPHTAALWQALLGGRLAPRQRPVHRSTSWAITLLEVVMAVPSMSASASACSFVLAAALHSATYSLNVAPPLPSNSQGHLRMGPSALAGRSCTGEAGGRGVICGRCQPGKTFAQQKASEARLPHPCSCYELGKASGRPVQPPTELATPAPRPPLLAQLLSLRGQPLLHGQLLPPRLDVLCNGPLAVHHARLTPQLLQRQQAGIQPGAARGRHRLRVQAVPQQAQHLGAPRALVGRAVRRAQQLQRGTLQAWGGGEGAPSGGQAASGNGRVRMVESLVFHSLLYGRARPRGCLQGMQAAAG